MILKKSVQIRPISKIRVLADFVVLSDDILTIDPINNFEVKIDMTVFDGKIVY